MVTRRKRTRRRRKSSVKNNKSKPTSKTKPTRPVARMTGYQKLIADPCSANLTRSFANSGGSSIVERTRTSITLNETIPTETENGYILWFPSYHGSGSEPFSGQNWYYFVNSNSGDKPLNTGADPLGLVSANRTGRWLIDPAHNNLEADSIFSTGRTIAACLTMDYIGPLNTAAGQYAVVQNFDVNALVDSKTLLDFPSVDEVFDYAISRGRLPLEGHQVLWRPSDEDCKARSAPASTGSNTAKIPDALFLSGDDVTGQTSRLNEVDPGEARGICIAWRGVPPNSLVFNAVKVAEYTLSMKSKAVEVPVTSTVPGLSIDKAVSTLDRMMPGWQESALRGAGALARKAMSAYILPSAATYLSNSGSNFAIMDGEL